MGILQNIAFNAFPQKQPKLILHKNNYIQHLSMHIA